MAEEQRQSLGADEQPIDNTLNEPSIGMLYDLSLIHISEPTRH